MSTVVFSLLDTPAYGGAEQYLLSALFELKKSGHRVVLATNNPQVQKKAQANIEVVDLPYRLDAIGNWKGLVKYFLALPGAVLWLIFTIRKLQKESINDELSTVNCIFPGYTDRLSFSPIVKLLRCQLIWLEYGPLEPTFQRNHEFPKFLYAMGRPFPDKVVTISEWTRRSLVNLGKLPAEKVRIICPGTQVSGVRHKVQGKILQPNTLNLKPQIVIAVARLATEKEVDLLLQAWKKVNRKNKKLVIVGDGPEREKLEKLAMQLQIKDSVQFMGFITEQRKKELLRTADLFVFPSAWELEGFGMTTIEAMIEGTPVLTTGFGPQDEIVENGITGWTFRSHDENDLAEKIQTILSSPTREVIAKQGQKSIKKRFSYERFTSSWVKLLRSE